MFLNIVLSYHFTPQTLADDTALHNQINKESTANTGNGICQIQESAGFIINSYEKTNTKPKHVLTL
jgi:hypothetical protein